MVQHTPGPWTRDRFGQLRGPNGEEGQLLIDRLTELDGASADPVEFMREFYGHVSPVLARFRDTLAKATGAA